MTFEEITKNYNALDFFDRVKTLVKQNTNMTIREFTEYAGIKYEGYCTLRKTLNFPRCNDGQKIADALGVSLDYLVTGEIKNSENMSFEGDLKNILDNLLELKEDQRELLLMMLKEQIKYFQTKNGQD